MSLKNGDKAKTNTYMPMINVLLLSFFVCVVDLPVFHLNSSLSSPKLNSNEDVFFFFNFSILSSVSLQLVFHPFVWSKNENLIWPWLNKHNMKTFFILNKINWQRTYDAHNQLYLGNNLKLQIKTDLQLPWVFFGPSLFPELFPPVFLLELPAFFEAQRMQLVVEARYGFKNCGGSRGRGKKNVLIIANNN